MWHEVHKGLRLCVGGTCSRAWPSCLPGKYVWHDGSTSSGVVSPASPGSALLSGWDGDGWPTRPRPKPSDLSVNSGQLGAWPLPGELPWPVTAITGEPTVALAWGGGRQRALRESNVCRRCSRGCWVLAGPMRSRSSAKFGLLCRFAPTAAASRAHAPQYCHA